MGRIKHNLKWLPALTYRKLIESHQKPARRVDLPTDLRWKLTADELDRRLRNASPRVTEGGCSSAREVGEEEDKATVLLG
jgi:hypothetical protein